MSNLFTQNPMILDTVWTAGTIPAALTGLTSWQDFSVIKWIGNTTAADECKITDINGNVLFDEVIVAANVGLDIVLWDTAVMGHKYSLKKGLWVLVTLTHGKVYLYR